MSEEGVLIKLIEEQLVLREICRERLLSAEMSEKQPIDRKFIKWEKCLKCQCDINSDIVCGIKKQLKMNMKELEMLQELPDEKMIKE